MSAVRLCCRIAAPSRTATSYRRLHPVHPASRNLDSFNLTPSCALPLSPALALSLLALLFFSLSGLAEKNEKEKKLLETSSPRTPRALATKLLCFGKSDHGFCCSCCRACRRACSSRLPCQLPSGPGPLFVFPQGRDPTVSRGDGREPSIPLCRGSRSSSVCACMDVRSSRLGSAAASGLQTCPGGWVAHSAHQCLVSRRVNKSIGWALSPRQPQLLPNLSAAQSVCIC